MPRDNLIQFRQGTAAQWTSANPILASGETGFETDTNKFKIGDGTTAWASLKYQGGGSTTISETAPSSPSAGNLWFKSSTGQTFIYYTDANSSQWIELTTAGPVGPQGADGTYTVSSTAPSAPTAGRGWFNTTDGRMYVWSGTEWFEPVTGAQGASGVYSVGTTAPSSPTNGQGWLNTNTGRLYIWSGTEWFEPTNNQAGAQGVSLYGGSVIAAQTAATNGVIIQGATSQTADLTQWKNSAGTTMANVAYDGSASFTNNNAAGKNVIINGGMDFWQRGTSFTGFAAGQYAADRWTYTASGTGISTNVTQDSSVPTAQYKTSIKYTQTTTATVSEWRARQWLEVASVRPLQGKTVTMSFWYKSSITGTHTARLGIYQATGTGLDSSVGFTYSTAGVWQYVTVTHSCLVNTTGWSVADNQPGAFADIGPNATSLAANDYFQFVGVQIEMGSVATPFSRAGGTIQGELAACQRYYYRIGGDNLYQYMGTGTASSTTNALLLIQHLVKMRVKPTSVEFSTLGLRSYVTNSIWSVTAMSINVDSHGSDASAINATVAGGLSAGTRFDLLANASISAYIGFSAEL